MTLAAYSPPRDLLSRMRRRLTARHVARRAMLRFDAPLLSITFDDFPASAADVGARILESHGARGTYYAAAGLADTDGPSGRNFSPTHVTRLLRAGHEIACHSFGHDDCARRPTLDTLRDIARNRDALAAMGCPQQQAFAYPYGETTRDLKSHLPPRFATARGITPGLVRGAVDLAQLPAYPLFGAGAMRRAAQALNRAARRNAWMIAFTHDVGDAPSPFGASAADLDTFLRLAHTLGVTVLPVTAALTRRV